MEENTKPTPIPVSTPSPSTWSDVAQPGQTPSNPNSKPVIVSNRPMQPDPMLSAAHSSAPGGQVASPIAQSTLAADPSQAAAVPVPSNVAHHHHRLKIMLPLIAGILILFIAADLLIDAGVIHTSITPLTHFFHHR